MTMKCPPFLSRPIPLCILTLLMLPSPAVVAATVTVSTAPELATAVNEGSAGDTIHVAAGTYALTAPLKPKANMTIKGAGISRTMLQPAAAWRPAKAERIEPINWNRVNREAYLFDLGGNTGTHHVSISDMEIDGLKQLHGAMAGHVINHLTVSNMHFHDFTFCGVRVVGGSNLLVRGCEFINMAVEGMDPEAGAVVFAWLSDAEFCHNRIFYATRGEYYGAGANAGNFYGIKGRQLKKGRIHHNTIRVNFSVELPFDDNVDVEIDHNYLDGWISMPKHAGGTVPPAGVSCRIHHNYDTSGVVVEYPRNAVEIDHNLLDNPRSEAGSMLSGWTSEPAPGPTRMHNNLINNLGRVLGDIGLYNNLMFYNNHVKAPANAGAENMLWIIDGNIDRAKFVFRDNIVDCTGKPRALLWQELGEGFTAIRNNSLIEVTDQANYHNPETGDPRGLLEPLLFRCGADGEYTVSGWTIQKTAPESGGRTERESVSGPGAK